MTDSLDNGFEGGCACGKVRYRASAAPRYMGNCHCRDCQQATGAGFFPGVGVRADAFAVTAGEPKSFARRSDSGTATIRRYFCGDCGSPVFLRNEATGRFAVIYAGSLDDPSWFKPATDIYTTSAQPWTLMHEDTAKSEKMPG